MYPLGIFIIFVLIYVANRAESPHPTRAPIRWLQVGLIAAVVLFATLLALDPVDAVGSMSVFMMTLITVFAVVGFTIVLSHRVRERLGTVIGSSGAFNPRSTVHTTALILVLVWLLVAMLTFVQIGGQGGLAETLQNENALNITNVVLDGLLYVCVAIVGVGLFVRRSPPEVLKRLGLQRPTLEDIMWGTVAGVGLFVLITTASLIWNAVTTPEIFETQNAAARQIIQTFGTLPLGFVLAVSAAVGEEILYRGALQPIFGLWLTSTLFAILHLQYTLTPASLLIFIVGVAFGLLRQRRNTNTAIIAHFVYNFIPFILLSIVNAQVM